MAASHTKHLRQRSLSEEVLVPVAFHQDAATTEVGQLRSVLTVFAAGKLGVGLTNALGHQDRSCSRPFASCYFAQRGMVTHDVVGMATTDLQTVEEDHTLVLTGLRFALYQAQQCLLTFVVAAESIDLRYACIVVDHLVALVAHLGQLAYLVFVGHADHDVVDVGLTLGVDVHGVTQESGLRLQLPRLVDTVTIVVDAGALVADGLRRSTVEQDVVRRAVVGDGERHVGGIGLAIAFLTVAVLRLGSLHTTHHGGGLRHEEGVHTGITLLAVGIAEGIEVALGDEHLEAVVAIGIGVGGCVVIAAGLGDIVEGIAQTDEGVDERRAHLAVDVAALVGAFLQGLDELGRRQILRLRHEQAVQDIRWHDVHLEGLVQGAGTHVDEGVVLVDATHLCVVVERCHRDDISRGLVHTVQARHILFLDGGIGLAHNLERVVGHTRTGQHRRHRDGHVVDESVVALFLPAGMVVPADTLAVGRRQLQVVDARHTAALHGTVVEGVAVGTEALALCHGVEVAGHVGQVVGRVGPEHRRVGDEVGVLGAEVDTATRQGCRVVEDGRGVDACIGHRVVLQLRRFHIDAAARRGAVVAHDGAADQGAWLEVESAAVVLGGIVHDDAVLDVGILCHHGTAADAVACIGTVGGTVYYKESVEHGTVFLLGEACQLVGLILVAYEVELLVEVEEVVGERHGVEDATRCSRGLIGDVAAEAGGVAQNVACVVFEGSVVATHHLDAAWHDERVFQEVLLLLVVGHAGTCRHVVEVGLRRGVVAGQLHDDGAVLQRLHEGVDIGIGGNALVDQLGAKHGLGEVGADRVGYVVEVGGILPAAGGVKHLLQLRGAGSVGRAVGRGQAAATVLRDVEDGLALLCQVGLDILRAVVLVGTLVHLTVLHAGSTVDVDGDFPIFLQHFSILAITFVDAILSKTFNCGIDTIRVL